MATHTTGIPALMILGRAIIERLKTPKREPGPSLEHIDNLTRILANNSVVSNAISVDLEPGMKDWRDVGLDVDTDDEVTLFAGGDINASRLADIRMGPKVVLWYRIGRDGPMHKTPNETLSFRADRKGPIYLALQAPGDWTNEAGDFDPAKIMHGVCGRVRILIVKWGAGVEQGLSALLPADNTGLIKSALAQWQRPAIKPQGWRYLWRIGAGDIYTPGTEQGHICCHTDRDAGILQIPADFALTDSTRFSWKWFATVLPSSIREDIPPTHDYLSIAVEFDNGLDLTYMWSSELAVNTIFQCPLPWWIERETHWVLRSDASDLGKWLPEDRNIKSDYERAIGGPVPERIVAVWLIAVSAFQRGEGKIDYANILLSDANQQLSLA